MAAFDSLFLLCLLVKELVRRGRGGGGVFGGEGRLSWLWGSFKICRLGSFVTWHVCMHTFLSGNVLMKNGPYKMMDDTCSTRSLLPYFVSPPVFCFCMTDAHTCRYKDNV